MVQLVPAVNNNIVKATHKDDARQLVLVQSPHYFVQYPPSSLSCDSDFGASKLTSPCFELKQKGLYLRMESSAMEEEDKPSIPLWILGSLLFLQTSWPGHSAVSHSRRACGNQRTSVGTNMSCSRPACHHAEKPNLIVYYPLGGTYSSCSPDHTNRLMIPLQEVSLWCVLNQWHHSSWAGQMLILVWLWFAPWFQARPLHEVSGSVFHWLNKSPCHLRYCGLSNTESFFNRYLGLTGCSPSPGNNQHFEVFLQCLWDLKEALH